MEKKLTLRENLRTAMSNLLGEDSIDQVDCAVNVIEEFLDDYLNLSLEDQNEEREEIFKATTQQVWSYLVTELPKDPALKFDILLEVTESFLHSYIDSLNGQQQQLVKEKFKKLIEEIEGTDE